MPSGTKVGTMLDNNGGFHVGVCETKNKQLIPPPLFEATVVAEKEGEEPEGSDLVAALKKAYDVRL
jgi:hypothetical protein